MAAPAEITLKDLSGQWVLDKTLSDDTDPILQLQGVGYLTRKAIAWATITLHVKQYSEAGVVHIDIDQTATGGIKGTTELRVLNWSEKSHKDHLFGEVKGRSRWTDVGAEGWDALDSYLKEGWLTGDSEKSGPNGEVHVQSWVENTKDGWIANQIWGFIEIEGTRYYARRVVVTKGDKALKVRMVYKWEGKE